MGGDGQLVLLAGEAGIGKTRTVQELAGDAREAGGEVFWGSCVQGDGAPPYWPWVQIIRGFVHGRSPQSARKILGPRAAVVAEIVPHVVEHLGDLPPAPPVADPISARFRFHDAVATFLHDASEATPMVIVLDDLHWADEASLLLLEFAARQLGDSPILMLGTFRGGEVAREHPLHRSLGDLSRLRGFNRIDLRGLDGSETGRLLRIVLGRKVDADVVKGVHARTDGNPLYVRLVGGELGEEAHPTSGSTNGGVPAGVLAAIARRLHPLSDRCREVLTTAATIGRVFDIALLSHIESTSADEIAPVLEEAARRGVISVSAGPPEVGCFDHALTQEALREALPISERPAIHARIADALESVHGEEALTEHALELAEHCIQGADRIEAPRRVRALLAAGDYALSHYSNAQAESFFRRGIDAMGGASPDEMSGDLYFGLARAEAALGRPGGIPDFVRAFECYERSGLIEKAAAVAAYPAYCEPAPGHFAELCRRALKIVEPGSLDEGWVLAKLGGCSIDPLERKPAQGDYAAECLRKAHEIARRSQNTPLEVQVLTNWGFVEGRMQRFERARQRAEQAVELARRAGDPKAKAIALSILGVQLQHWHGTLHERRACAEELMETAGLLQEAWLEVFARWNAGAVYMTAGDLTEARRQHDRLLEINPEGFGALSRCVTVELELGNLKAGTEMIRRMVASWRKLPRRRDTGALLANHLAEYVLKSGDVRTEWLETAEECLAEVGDPPPSAVAAINAACAKAGLAVIRGDAEEAAAACGRYDELTSGPVGASHLLISIPLAERTAGRTKQALERLEQKAQEYRRVEARHGLAWVLYVWAETLTQDGTAPDGQAEARGHLRELLEVTDGTELHLVRTKAEKLLAKLGRSGGGDGLTRREQDVIRLVAAGKTNKEIGHELYISPKTVDSHVRNILRKTGCANRAEAAVYAADHGITERGDRRTEREHR